MAEKLATIPAASTADPMATLNQAVELVKKLQPEQGTRFSSRAQTSIVDE